MRKGLGKYLLGFFNTGMIKHKNTRTQKVHGNCYPWTFCVLVLKTSFMQKKFIEKAHVVFCTSNKSTMPKFLQS